MIFKRKDEKNLWGKPNESPHLSSVFNYEVFTKNFSGVKDLVTMFVHIPLHYCSGVFLKWRVRPTQQPMSTLTFVVY